MNTVTATDVGANVDSRNGHDKVTEARVSQALEEYAAAIDAGAPMSRDDLIAAYPDVADEVIGCFDSLDFIRQAAPQLGDGAAAGAGHDGAAVRPLATLGDFRIVREIGRGGMGVVYEAEQLSLGRKVALKVLPFAAMLDKLQLKRFKNEARAAATLDHPNIVAIYSVGEERGVHFYAMQLIEGRSLAEVVEQLRISNSRLQDNMGNAETLARELSASDSQVESAPSHSAIRNPQSEIDTRPRAAIATLPEFNDREYFRAVARLGVQAAEALDHAHRQGVIHRDVKPGNLLVDDAGKLWVTDFGLARIEADVGMTMTGDLVGTLRYMSPEQALANRAVVDHRSDVYSLGMTLYELLTLEPAFAGEDRQELLRQIAFDEPRRLRQIDRRIPIDFETIVGKAIEKSPGDRYATAQDLAGDLHRFVADQPIKAAPPSVASRMQRWIGRNPTMVGAATLATALLFVVALIGTAIVGRAWSEASTAQAETAAQRDRYLGERDTALRNLYVADIRLAHQEWQDGHLASFDAMLDRHIPARGQPEHRGWEWYYLKSLGQRELATLSGHIADVISVAWSPDGQMVASGCGDATVKIWDASTRRERSTLRGHAGGVMSVAWSPDGRRLASSGWDATVRIWDVASAKEILNIPTEFGWMGRRVAWSPDGTRIAACGTSGPSPDGGEGLAKVWDARTGQELAQMNGPEGLVWAVAWSPDGQRIATASGGKLRIWDANSSRLLAEIEEFGGASSLAWSPDGRRVAGTLGVWDLSTGKQQWRSSAHPGGATCVVWDPTGQRLASAGFDGTVKIWTSEGELQNTLRGHRAAVFSVDWRSDGRRLVSGSVDGAIKVWEPDSHQLFSRIDAPGCARWRPDAPATLAAMSVVDDRLFKLNFHAGPAWNVHGTTTLSLEKQDFLVPSSYAFRADGKQLAFGRSLDGAVVVTILETDTGAAVATMREPTGSMTKELAWNPTSSLLAVVLDGKGGVVVWDVSNRSKVAHLRVPNDEDREGCDSANWSPDGKRLAVSSWDQRLTVFDASTWREVVRLDRSSGTTVLKYGGENVTAWSPDGKTLAAATARGEVILWDTTTWREALSFSAHTASTSTIAFSPDGTRLVTGGSDGAVKIWDARDARQLLTLRGHISGVHRVSWSSDGRSLLSSGGTDQLVWDASTAMQLQHH